MHSIYSTYYRQMQSTENRVGVVPSLQLVCMFETHFGSNGANFTSLSLHPRLSRLSLESLDTQHKETTFNMAQHGVWV